MVTIEKWLHKLENETKKKKKKKKCPNRKRKEIENMQSKLGDRNFRGENSKNWIIEVIRKTEV